MQTFDVGVVSTLKKFPIIGKKNPVFSNHWKNHVKSFQSLEKNSPFFPIIGKMPKKVSNGWKLFFVALAGLPLSAQALSSGYFYEQTNYVVSSPYGVKLGDLDGDGDQDLAIARPVGSLVFTNDGGVFYNSGQTLNNWYELDVADFNGDGALDVYGGGESSGRVWTNNGHGVFAAFGPTTTNAYTMRCAADDLTGDGYPDVVVANWDGPSKVWTNDGTGRLLYSESIFDTNAYTVALGDLTGDGFPDAVCGDADSWLLVYTNNRSGKLVYDLQNLAMGTAHGVSAVIGDVNGDTYADVLLGEYGADSQVWTNNGAGKLSNTGQSLNSLNVNDALLADVDGDGDLDAILTQTIYGPAVWINNGAGVFTLRPHSFSNSGSTWGTCGDVDGDGDVDIVVSDLGNRVRIYINEWSRMTVLGTNGSEVTNQAAASVASGTDFGGPHEPGIVFTNTFTITNSVPVRLDLKPAVTNGAGASQFRVIGLAGTVGAQGASTFQIHYRPTTPGVVEASVLITNSSSNAVFVLHLRGESSWPALTNTSPANAAPSVGVALNLSAQANQRLAAATLTSNTFLLHSDQRGFLPGGLSYNDATRTATLNPTDIFLPGERLFAQVTRGVSNAW
ncbi:MAG: hypothetical protein EOM20_20545, partial [Spartobacteria bacterium]|nr:hypothetical protein [Spartobacteria bacterium]